MGELTLQKSAAHPTPYPPGHATVPDGLSEGSMKLGYPHFLHLIKKNHFAFLTVKHHHFDRSTLESIFTVT